jgi:hypothetical protein
MVCANATDQMCTRTFSMDNNTLKNMGLKRAPYCHRQHLKMSFKSALSGRVACSTQSTS